MSIPDSNGQLYAGVAAASAQAYEGLIKARRIDVEIGRRYWFQPRMCMMQWRHSGLVNCMNHTDDGIQVRIEGLWIG